MSTQITVGKRNYFMSYGIVAIENTHSEITETMTFTQIIAKLTSWEYHETPP